MIHTNSTNRITTLFCFLLFSIFSNSMFACMGTGIGNATTFYNTSNNETTVEIEFCLGITDLFGLPSDFDIIFEGISATPSLAANASTLTASYNFSEDAISTGFFCNCNNTGIGAAPTILSNTDTWNATMSAGKVSYNVSRSDNRLNNECQIDCVNGEPTALSGGTNNYKTNISTCYIINANFAGDIEGVIAGITLIGAENGICNGNADMSFGLNEFLPVELGSFEGVSKENSVAINWTTLSETNVYKYIVERSEDGFTQFKELGETAVFGNSQAIKSYTFEDTTPLAKGFYRLKTVDIDGTFSHSDIILVEREIADIRVVNIYPNPVKDLTEIIYETKAYSSIHFKVFDVNGMLKADQVLEADNGFNKIPFDFSGLREGVYFITLESGNEKIVKRVTKF